MAELKVSNVSKSFDGVKILEDITIELHDQELVSLLGVSGGGKTTLFNVISGLEKPETGNVYLDGREITGVPGNVSYMLQKDMLLPYRTIEDNVALPLLIKGENHSDLLCRFDRNYRNCTDPFPFQRCESVYSIH